MCIRDSYIADRDGLPTLIGTLNLEKIQFKIPLSLQSSESTKDMGVDVTVHAGKGVRLYCLLYTSRCV